MSSALSLCALRSLALHGNNDLDEAENVSPCLRGVCRTGWLVCLLRAPNLSPLTNGFYTSGCHGAGVAFTPVPNVIKLEDIYFTAFVLHIKYRGSLCRTTPHFFFFFFSKVWIISQIGLHGTSCFKQSLSVMHKFCHQSFFCYLSIICYSFILLSFNLWLVGCGVGGEGGETEGG